MTVQELFKSIDEDEFIETYLRNDNETMDCIFRTDISINEIALQVNHFKELVLNALHRFKNMELERNEEYIVFAIPDDNGSIPVDTFLVKTSELKEAKIDKIERYAYEFSAHKEILSYDISDACRHRVDDDVLLAVAVFNEMTFLGIEEDVHDNRADEIMSELDKTSKEIEEGLAKTSPVADVFKQLGFEDTRTPEEKVFSYRLTQIQNNNYVQTLNVYFELEKYYLKRKGEKKDVI